MNNKNIGKKIFSNVSKGLVAMALLGLTTSCTINKGVIRETKEPAKIDYMITKENYFKILDKDGKGTGLYTGKWEYDKISKKGKKGELIELSTPFEGLYIKSGQGSITALWNNFWTGGSYMPVYSKRKFLKGTYISEVEMKSICSGETNGNFKKIPRTSLEVQCVSPKFNGGICPANLGDSCIPFDTENFQSDPLDINPKDNPFIG